MEPLDPIVAVVTVPVSPQHAFLAFTVQMGAWWDPLLSPDAGSYTGMEIDPGGEVALQHGADRYVWGEVTTWEPPRRYAQTFWLGHSPDHPTTLAVSFEGIDGGTLVRLEHGGWSDATADVRGNYTHWDELLERYAAHAGR